VTPQREPIFSEPTSLSSEICLLKLLPVKSPLIRSLETNLVDLSTLATIPTVTDVWKKASKTMEAAVQDLDNKRSQLAPVFNPEDSTQLAISKGERGEQLIESLRGKLVQLVAATKASALPETLVLQKEALLSLSEVGELLVSAFPYNVPTEGKYSYLPRLLGRARVTFTFRRKNEILGNMTIVADGFTAPISAGNFVDLCARNFYTGLPVKFTKKRVGLGSDFDVANVPILGSYQDGFYDPLTAKPRRIPLEIIRVEKSNGSPNLSYSQGLTGLPTKRAVLESPSNSQPLLSFNIPGLVALNHPDKNDNGASSEFFALQDDSVLEGRARLFDGEYAPFGFIVDGYDLHNALKTGDVIDQTVVDQWGLLNLVKIRRSSFSEVVQSTGESKEATD
jgi:peptidylprolyl isomerase